MSALHEVEAVQRLVVPSGCVAPMREKINLHCPRPTVQRLVEPEGAIVGVNSVMEAVDAVLLPEAEQAGDS